jgi:DNA-binding response OmpR family regulator
MTQTTPNAVLIVDDEPYIRDILSRFLTDAGHRCVTAASVDAALKLLGANNFSLILLDLMMPKKSGVTMLHKVKEQCPDVAVLVVSALDRQKLAAGLLKLGACGYITKPFDRDEIVNRVSSALQHREEVLLGRHSSPGLG